MAVLTDNQRAAVWAEFMRDVCKDREQYGTLTKADIRAAVNALDDFLNAQAATINSTIPQPARAQLTTAQKARLLTAVIRHRYIQGA